MSIPLKPHQSLQSLAAQGVSGFEEPVGTKNQENKKCPSNLEDIRELGERVKGNGTLGNVRRNNLRGQGERDELEDRGRGISGKSLIYQPLPPFTLSPIPFMKKKSQARIRQNPAPARLLGQFLFSLDSFYFPRTGFIFCLHKLNYKTALYSTVTLFAKFLGLSTSHPRPTAA
jgi:hypothetical protein